MPSKILNHSETPVQHKQTFLVPLNVSTPTSDPHQAKEVVHWISENLLSPGDHVILATCLPEELQIANHVGRFLLGALEYLSGELAMPDYEAAHDRLPERTRLILQALGRRLKGVRYRYASNVC